MLIECWFGFVQTSNANNAFIREWKQSQRVPQRSCKRGDSKVHISSRYTNWLNKQRQCNYLFNFNFRNEAPETSVKKEDDTLWRKNGDNAAHSQQNGDMGKDSPEMSTVETVNYQPETVDFPESPQPRKRLIPGVQGFMVNILNCYCFHNGFKICFIYKKL